MKLSVLPKTTLGKWSVGLMIGFFALFALFLGLALSGQEGGDTLLSNALLTIPIFMAAWCAIISAILGGISAIKEKRLSLLGTVAMAVGLVVAFFILGELLSPH